MNGYHYQHSGAHGAVGLALLAAGTHSVQIATHNAAIGRSAAKLAAQQRAQSVVSNISTSTSSTMPQSPGGAAPPKSPVNATASRPGSVATVKCAAASSNTATHSRTPLFIHPRSGWSNTLPARPRQAPAATTYAQSTYYASQSGYPYISQPGVGYPYLPTSTAAQYANRRPVFPPTSTAGGPGMTSAIAAMVGAFGSTSATVGLGAPFTYPAAHASASTTTTTTQPQRPHQLMRTNSHGAGAAPVVATSAVMAVNKDSFLKKLDSLPTGPQWERTEITVTGDLFDDAGEVLTEQLEIWRRDPVELVKELIGNPSFCKNLQFAPVRLRNRRNAKRVFNEAWTADWWWTVQEKLDSIKPGATVAPIILASDKTKLSYFSGDKAAWPVYLTIGNISKHIRRKPSKHAVLLLGYLPVAKLHCWSDSKRKAIGHDLFHACMRKLLEPLVTAGRDGVVMNCADNKARRVHPLLSAYIANHPERALTACVKANRCPPCPVHADEQGDLPRDRWGQRVVSILRDPEKAKHTIYDAFNEDIDAQAIAEMEGLQVVKDPFWANLPFSNIFMAFPPDILHQLHKGIFKDHLFTWCQTIMGEKEMDKRYMSMPSHPGLQHFKSGISKVSQWTGNEYKQMEKVFLGAIAGGVPSEAVEAAKALMDFIYWAQKPSLDEDDLNTMDQLLEKFHELKDHGAFSSVRDHFNIPKLHVLLHYTSLIRLHGTPDGYNTETPERLHIDYAKSGYRASNKKDYTKQMTKFMSRMEAVTIRRELIKYRFPETEDISGDNEDITDNDNTITEFPTEGAEGESPDEDGSSEEVSDDNELSEPHTAETQVSNISLPQIMTGSLSSKELEYI
ncbi:hypothetical protein FRC05_007839 [Tulasnella sp. 425]|nr:hypothetical protein FRC05_007839 [Tulasnella sp. 425]